MKSMIVLSQEELENLIYNSVANQMVNNYAIQAPYQNDGPEIGYANARGGNQQRMRTTFEHRIGENGKLEVMMAVEPAE